MSWLDTLLDTGALQRSQVPAKHQADISGWLTANFLFLRKAGRGQVLAVVPEHAEAFRKATARLREQLLAEQPENRIAATTDFGNSKLAKTKDGIATFFVAKDGAETLHACRLSQLPEKLTALGLTNPTIALLENQDILVSWEPGFATALGIQDADVVILTRGQELIRAETFDALLRCGAHKVWCAFDFDAAGLGFFRQTKLGLGDRCAMAAPAVDLEACFGRQKQINPETGSKLRHNAKLDGEALLGDPVATRCHELMVRYGVGIEQQSFLRRAD